MNLGLRDAVVVVVGGANGIGEACVARLLAEGARVVCADRADSALSHTSSFSSYVVDIRDTVAVEQLFAEVHDRYGRVDSLVNTAAIFPTRSSFDCITDEEWRATFEINLLGTIRTCRAAIKVMKSSPGTKSIVNVTATAGSLPEPLLFDYSVSKAAVRSLTKALAIEFAPFGIRCNAVSPGPTRTAAWDRPGGFLESLQNRFGTDSDEAVRRFVTEIHPIPLQRMGSPDDVASVISFVISKLCLNVSASEYGVDGGIFPVI